MKAALAALLLLFQLQPVLGSVVCFGRTGAAAQQDCRMPEHGRTAATLIGSPAEGTQACALASICAPPAPAVPGLASHLETATSLLTSAGTLADTLIVGISASPPFHPPRA